MYMKDIFKKRKALMFSILILVVFFTSFSFVFAVGLPYFGGKITNVTQCTCSPGSQVTIIGYPATFSGTYLYSPATLLKTGKGVRANAMILGKYSYGGTCMMAGEPCTSLPITKGTMTMIGTN